MLTKKLLAAVGIAGALFLGATADASANPWRGPHFRPVPVYRPVYRAPVYAPIYRAPVVYGPTYAPVYPTPVYVPVYRPVAWRHPGWGRMYGRHW